MKRWSLILGLMLLAAPAYAQNPTCPTRPTSDNSNACASTAFVGNKIAVSSQFIYDTRAIAAAATVPNTINYIQTQNYAIAGDYGGGTYVRGGTCSPTSVACFTSADGAAWKLVDRNINIQQFGAVPSGSDPTAAITDAINFSNANTIQVNSLYFGAGVYTLTAELPCFTHITEIFGNSNSSQLTIILKNFTSSNATRGMFCFTDFSPYLHDLNIRATGGTLGSGISIISSTDTATLAQPIFDRIVVSGGDHFNYSFYADGAANTVAPIGLRNILGSSNYFFGAAIESVHLFGVKQFLMTNTVIDTSGGSGVTALKLDGTAGVTTDNVSITGIFNTISMDRATAVTLNGTAGTITTTANTGTWSNAAPNTSVKNLLLPTGGQINWGNGDVNIVEGANGPLSFTGASVGGYTFDNTVYPSTNLAAQLGTASSGWSSLYLGGNSSGIGQLIAPAAASAFVWTLPSATGTLLYSGGPGIFSSASSPVYIVTGSSPTLTSGSCSGSAATGGSTAGKFTAPACAGGTIILSALPTAPNGYTCDAQDQTDSTKTLKQTANTVTSATFLSTTTNNDVIVFKCMAW